MRSEERYHPCMLDVFRRAHAVLIEPEPAAKCALARDLLRDWDAARLTVDPGDFAVEPVVEPGRPDRPVLVLPRVVVRRKVSTRSGRAALIHSLAHIEFNE